MNLFFSGVTATSIEFDARLRPGIRHRLLSCHGHYLKFAHKMSATLHEVGQPFELMYDSGAFTAWSQGDEVLLEDLIEIYDDLLSKYETGTAATWLISLDKIPGKRGVTATPAEIEEAVRISDQNFEVLAKRYGDRVLPVFHQNESTARLHEVAAMAPYICVSPRNDLHEASRRRWSAEVHAAIPGKRTHGLAATGYDMMTKVPWGSVDSATWVMLASNGAVFSDTRLRALNVSDQSVALKDANQHLRTMPPLAQKAFRDFAEARGFSVEGLESNANDRMTFNRVVMTEVMDAIPAPEVVAKAVPTELPLFDL